MYNDAATKTECQNKRVCISPVEIITQKPEVCSPSPPQASQTTKIPFWPFLKSKSELKLANPKIEENVVVCLVKKNTVYAKSIDDKKIIVKSQ